MLTAGNTMYIRTEITVRTFSHLFEKIKFFAWLAVFV